MKGASITPVKITIKSEIDEIQKLFQENPANKEISFINTLEDDLCVLSDINHFRIIFRNLISNAVKFTEKLGTIKVLGEIKSDKVKISVLDDGIGMTKENIAKIWSQNEHLSTYGTHSEKGTGLGLMLCKEMVEKNKGFIFLKSEPNTGTTFSVYLPKC
ncbi:HAMP domain-containing histidine kinase [Maribacter litopenaei]|uniref:histidine kinase n=1 Tax=Maribacter litopenaei TaxID=2976127 RepID=A0ABY5YCY1_9FLAO|nr:HAMP domain-containing sensor histidine kinase [Maribacter litopenaei]UWX56280.1 HAMP domain-containing histidine kinase [Maribacter litopenaei]